MDGIGWRNDKVSEDIAAMDVPWDIFWESQAYRGPGRHPRRPPRRAQHADAARRDAARASARTSTPRTQALIDKAQRDLSALGPICNPKITITDYQTLPEGKTVLHHSWSGDLLGAAFYYMPKGVPPTVLSFWGPDANGVVQNDFFCIGKTSKSPVLAHEFINFFLDEKNAYDNFVNFTGLHAAAEEHRRGGADQAGRDPGDARAGGRPARPVRREPGAAAAERRGPAVLGRRLVEVQGRLMQQSRWTWRLLALPGVAWLSVFFLVAFYAVLAVAFGNQDTLSQPVPYWNPLDWNVGYVLEMLREPLERRPVPHGLAPHDRVRRHRGRPLAPDRLPGRLLHGPPRGPLEGRHPARADPAAVDQLPDADAGLDQPARARRDRLARCCTRSGSRGCSCTIGLLDEPGGWLNGQPTTVILALVYGYIPFFILPLFVAIDRIDKRQIEAARDLGASPLSAFLRVTLPLSVPGILAGAVLIALPMFGDYYTADLVSASTQTNMIGNQIDEFMRQGSEKVTGAALTLLLSSFLLILMFYYLRTTRQAGTSAQTTA